MFKRKADYAPYIIAGPCSAESYRQLYDTALELKKNVKLDLLRAGIWKPRTRPNSFEGYGEEALKWLYDVKKELQLKTTVEVANAKHVELALKHKVDVLWIGARTSVNPFSVQEIADALKGVNIPVMVKNPINPDLQLWIGAIERLEHSGITNIAAIHRGFSSYGKSSYRNIPMWQIPIELRRLYPELPLICDPSHIGGNRELIQPLAQKSMDLTFDGLMIESHYNPDIALSDAQQQITPLVLKNILENLILRNKAISQTDVYTQLLEIRSKIDEVDETIINSILERIKLIEQIGKIKKENNIPILQVKRWNEVLEHLMRYGVNLGLSETFLKDYLTALHSESIRKQTDIMNKS